MKLNLEGEKKTHVEAKSESWFYSPEVKEHFFHPKNIFTSEEEIKKFKADGVGRVGSPACGDMMEMWIKVKDDKIVECKWMTFGCVSAIASTSMLSVMVTEDGGMKIENALKIKPNDIILKLGGLPKRKVHCSVLGDKALRAAINDYFKKSEQYDRIIVEDAKVIDKILKVTDKDIEKAVLDGALNFEEVQKKTKVGIHDKSCIPEVEELIKFYKKKYFGE
ncbi:iron-sulfur cluster assembly scaffold protein [Candidatus Woesearchaeota archaeon CG10_big_fil_rev_8_21_14_0_10_34_8]|jgi:NifU-like protein involved in Fe-S cluster formation/bacterioferritin-associated ferredoxin|nr:MAG: iron-sulfur cluster assembly scaffold protein [Candidatus Woesearchaeota archaeon CG10_big_fil_rev_8_21_14_0_10_34_8]